MAVSATDSKPTVVISQDGARGASGTNGSDGSGFSSVRKSLIDNPLCHLFKKNDIDSVVAGALTSTRSTTANYVDRYGVIQSAAVDEEREEADGWLIEGASTNLATYSEQLDNAAWVQSGTGSVTANSTTAPDGATTADTLIDTDVAADATYFQLGVAVGNDSVTRTFSVFFKESTALAPAIGLFYVGGTTISSVGTYTFSTQSASNATAVSMGNGWVRLSITFANNSSGNTTALLRLYPAGSNASVTGETFAWGAQLEALPFVSSYIPTVASAVSRTVDINTMPALNNLPLNEFSVFCKIADVGAFTGTHRFILQTAVTSGNLYIYLDGASDFIFFIFGAETISLAYTPNTDLSITARADITDVYLTINGASITAARTTATNIVSSATTDTMNWSTGSQVNSNILDFRVYDFALNADEITYLED